MKRTPPVSINPVYPSAALVIDGQEYRLVYDYGAIAEAEAVVNRGRSTAERVNLLYGLMVMMDAATLPGLLLAALRAQHPAITFEQVRAMIRPDTALDIYNAIHAANDLARPDAKRKDPTPASGDPGAAAGSRTPNSGETTGSQPATPSA